MIAAAVVPPDGFYTCYFKNGVKKELEVINREWHYKKITVKHFNFKYVK